MHRDTTWRSANVLRELAITPASHPTPCHSPNAFALDRDQGVWQATAPLCHRNHAQRTHGAVPAKGQDTRA